MKLFNWVRRRKLEQSLDSELNYHIDRRTSDLIASGLPEAEARRRALLEVGRPTQIREEVRDVWLTRWLRDFAYDLRFSARSFLRTPSFTVTALLSLALGIGATTAIYSLVDQVVLHSLPVRDPGQLVLVDWKGPQLSSGFGSYNLMSYPICRDLQQQSQLFENVLCRAAVSVILSTGGDHKPTASEIVSGSYFSTLGIEPALGRLIQAEDDATPDASPVVVLSHDFWRNQLGGAQDVIGRKVLVNNHPMTVIGVASSTFRGIDVGEVPALWIPASMASTAIPGFTDLLNRRQRWMQILARLKSGVSLTQAETGLQPWFKAMLDEDTRRPGFPNVTADARQRFLGSYLQLTPSPQGHSPMKRRFTEPLWVLFAATSVLLGLACLNVAGLFLARGSARAREISTRLALGASRGRIGRQFLADSVLLALTGGVLGVLLAPFAMQTLIAFLPRDAAGNALHASIDWRLMFFALGVSVTAGVLSGFAPALQAGRGVDTSSLRDRSGIVIGGVRLRKAIVTLQIAFTLVLVTGAALFIRTLNGLMTKGPGFNTSSLVSFGLDPRRSGYRPADTVRLFRNIHEELKASPLVESEAGIRFSLLTGGSWNNPMTIQSNTRIITDRDVHMNAITPTFFATLGAKIVAGRNFEQRDYPKSGAAPANVIINESFAKRYFGGRSPLGALVCTGSGPDAKPNQEIIGVVSDFAYRGLREESDQVFFPNDDGGNFYLRVRGTSDAALRSIRAIVQKADPSLPLIYFRTIEEQLNRSLVIERILATLSGGFAAIALLLSLVGLYGVMSFVVTQRTREIGIRLALGATSGSTLWLVLRDALLMITLGAAIALPSIAALGRLIQSQLFGVKPMDPTAITAATLILSTAALIAALIPAHRAATVSPTDALRFE